MMFIYRTLRMAVKALLRNVTRSALTTLGIVIGIAAVIAMVAIGQGSSKAIEARIKSMGANNLLVLPGAASSSGTSWGSGTAMTLTPNDVDAIKRECPAISHVTPVVRVKNPQVVYGNRNWSPPQIYGTSPDFLTIRDWELDEGENFTDKDVRNGSKVCLIGRTCLQELFPDESPVGKEIRISNVSFKVIGVLSRKGANMFGQDQDDVFLAPWTTTKYRIAGVTQANVNQIATAATATGAPPAPTSTAGLLYPTIVNGTYTTPTAAQQADTPLPVRFTNVDQILAQADSPEDTKAAIGQITESLRVTHHVRKGQLEDFTIRDMTEMSEAMGATTNLMAKLVLCVAMISLVVGGVGIMNIMLVSVMERTKEIGLRMAVGARARDILVQFLVEAIVLCFMGGVMGILFGLASAATVHKVLGWTVIYSILPVIGSVMVSVLVGVIFGFYPAWKASGLDPIEALRYE
jgi:ABC-type antimicrobial peptide transport system permease subunit